MRKSGYLGSIREAYLSLSVNYGQNSAPGQSLVLARTSTPNPPPRKFEGGLSLPKYSTHLASHTSLFCVGTHLLNSIIGFHEHFDAQTPGVSILRKFAREGAAVSSCGVKESDHPLPSPRQSAKADLAAGTSPRQSAKADLAAGTSPRQSAKADLAAGTSPRRSAKASLAAGTSPRQSAKADLAAGTSPRQSAKADLAAGTSPRRSAKASLAAGTSPRQSAKADLPTGTSPRRSVKADLPAWTSPRRSVKADLSTRTSPRRSAKADLAAGASSRRSAKAPSGALPAGYTGPGPAAQKGLLLYA